MGNLVGKRTLKGPEEKGLKEKMVQKKGGSYYELKKRTVPCRQGRGDRIITSSNKPPRSEGLKREWKGGSAKRRRGADNKSLVARKKKADRMSVRRLEIYPSGAAATTSNSRKNYVKKGKGARKSNLKGPTTATLEKPIYTWFKG